MASYAKRIKIALGPQKMQTVNIFTLTRHPPLASISTLFTSSAQAVPRVRAEPSETELRDKARTEPR